MLLEVADAAFSWPAETWEYVRAAMSIGVFSLGVWIGLAL